MRTAVYLLLNLVAFGLWAAPLPAIGGPPPVPAALLTRLERDISGALTHIAALREGREIGATGPPLAAGVDVAAAGDPVELAPLRATINRLQQRLAELAGEVRARGDPRLQFVVRIMADELKGLHQAVNTLLALPDPEMRKQALDRLERGLTQLDGATAALWTFDR